MQGSVSVVKTLALGICVATTMPLLIPAARNFEYEYWLLATITFALYCLAHLARNSPTPIKQHRGIVHGGVPSLPALALPLLALAFLALPVLALALSSLWRMLLSCPCSAGEFSFWWLWQFVPSALSLIALHQILASSATLWTRRWHKLTFGLAVILLPLLLLWFFPQKRLLTPFVGYIHGPIYDRLIPFTDHQQLLRLVHSALAAAIILLSLKGYRRAPALALVALALSFAAAQQSTATNHGHDALRSKLSSVIKRDGLRLWFRQAGFAASGMTKGRAEELADEAAFHIRDLSQLLGLTLRADGQGMTQPEVDIYVYPDRLSKKAWFGGLTTDIADVYSPSIHITADRFPHGTLRHELVHALTSAAGFWGLGFHPNMAITEGLAVYLAPSTSAFGLHTEAATITKLFWQDRVEGLFGPLFWTYSGQRAYRVAGSLLRFLTERYGSAAVMNLYRGQSFRAAFGSSREAIIATWQKHLEQTYDPVLDEVMRNRFAYGGVLADSCPHSKASARQAKASARHAKTQGATGSNQDWWWQWRGDWQQPALAGGISGAKGKDKGKDELDRLLEPLALPIEAQQLRGLSRRIDQALIAKPGKDEVSGLELVAGQTLPVGLQLRLLLRKALVEALLALIEPATAQGDQNAKAQKAKAQKALAKAKALQGEKPAGLARLMALLQLLLNDPSLKKSPSNTRIGADIARFLLSGDSSILSTPAAQREAVSDPLRFVYSYLRLRNGKTSASDCMTAELPHQQPYVLARAWYQQRLRCLYRHRHDPPHHSSPQGKQGEFSWLDRASETIRTWQNLAPKTSEDYRALSIELELLAALKAARS